MLRKSNESPQSAPWPPASPDEGESTKEWEGETPEGLAALECDSGELPASDEETKVVLLPVNPYLVHVYWMIAAHDLEVLGRIFSRLGPRAQPALRFYDVSHVNLDGANGPGWFEVEIIVGAGSWYVRLESPAKSYYIDLGVHTEGGRFHRLARSNVAETPRAWPSDKVDESYLLVEGDYTPAETVVPPRAAAEGGRATLQSAPTYGEPQGRDKKEPEPKELRVSTPLDAVVPPVEAAEAGKAVLEPSSACEPSVREENQPDSRGSTRSAPTYAEPHGTEVKWPEPKELRIFNAVAPGEMERNLAEVYRRRLWEWASLKPKIGGAGEPQLLGKQCADLTEQSERSFRTGLSSEQKS